MNNVQTFLSIMDNQFDNKKVGERISRLRVTTGFNKREFAGRLAMDNGQYGKIEKGQMSLTLPQLFEVCSNFEVSADWILGLSDVAELMRGGQEQKEKAASWLKRLNLISPATKY